MRGDQHWADSGEQQFEAEKHGKIPKNKTVTLVAVTTPTMAMTPKMINKVPKAMNHLRYSRSS